MNRGGERDACIGLIFKMNNYFKNTLFIKLEYFLLIKALTIYELIEAKHNDKVDLSNKNKVIYKRVSIPSEFQEGKTILKREKVDFRFFHI